MNIKLNFSIKRLNPLTATAAISVIITLIWVVASLVMAITTFMRINQQPNADDVGQLLNQNAIDQAALLLQDQTVQFVPE